MGYLQLVMVAALVACGSDKRDFAAAKGGSGGTGGTGATSVVETGAVGGMGADASTGGTTINGTLGGSEVGGSADGDSGGDGGSGVDGRIPCDVDDSLRCSGIVAQVCSDGYWVDQQVCSSACEGEGVCTCAIGERQCVGQTPQACLNGAWVSETACDGQTEFCGGAGVCAPFKLLDAGLATLGIPGGDATTALRQHRLSAAPRVCSTDFCITGDIR